MFFYPSVVCSEASDKISEIKNDVCKSLWASQVELMVKNPPTTAGDMRNTGSIAGLGGTLGGGHGNPLQYSCLENLTNRGAW